MDEPQSIGDLSSGAKGVLGFIAVSFVTSLVLLLTMCVRRLVPARGSSTVAEKPKPKPCNGKATSKKEEAHVELHADATPATPSAPGISLKQLMKDSKAKSGMGAGQAKANQHALYVNTLKGAGDVINGVAFSADGKVVATTADDRTLRVYHIEDVVSKGIACRRCNLPYGAAGVAFGASADELALLTKGIADAAGLAGYRGVRRGAATPLESFWEQKDVLAGRLPLRLRSGITPGGAAVLLVAGTKTDLVVYSMQGTRLAGVDHGGILTHDAALSSNGRFFAAATFTSDVKVYEVSFDRGGAFSRVTKAMDLKGHKSQVLSVAFSPDASRMVTSSKDGTWALWNIAVRYAQNEDPKRLLSRTQEVAAPNLYRRFAYGPDGIIAALSGRDVHFLEAQSGSLLEVVETAHEGDILDMCWAPVNYPLPGGRLTAVLATCGTDNVVRLWRSPKV